MLMILLCTLIVIMYLILNLSMTYETQWAGLRSGFLISMLEKLNLFCLTCAIGVNMDVASLSFFYRNYFGKCLFELTELVPLLYSPDIRFLSSLS